jgi:hypothetical protein
VSQTFLAALFVQFLRAVKKAEAEFESELVESWRSKTPSTWKYGQAGVEIGHKFQPDGPGKLGKFVYISLTRLAAQAAVGCNAIVSQRLLTVPGSTGKG